MNIKKDNILIVGAGNMGLAFLSALLDNKVNPKKIFILENNPSQKLKKINKTRKFNLINSIYKIDIKTKIGITLLAIKPNHVVDIFNEHFNNITKKSVLISIVAGKTTATLKKLSKKNSLLIKLTGYFDISLRRERDSNPRSPL